MENLWVMCLENVVFSRENMAWKFDSLFREKGIRAAFTKLVSEEMWEQQINTMRVSDLIYLLFKLKGFQIVCDRT